MRDHQPADDPDVGGVREQQPQGGQAQHDSEDQRPHRDPDVVRPDLRRERRGRVLGVVVLELVVHEP